MGTPYQTRYSIYDSPYDYEKHNPAWGGYFENKRRREKLAKQIMRNLAALKSLTDTGVRISNLTTELPEPVIKKFESIYEFFGSHFDRVYGGEGFSDVNRSRANWGVIDRVRRMRGEVGFHMNMIRQGIENRTLNEKAYKSFLETPTKEFVDICLEKWPEDKTWFYTTIYYRSQEDSLREQGLRMVRTKAHT